VKRGAHDEVPLPEVPWAGLLWGIAKHAPPGALVEVHTPALRALTPERIRAYGRADIVVRLVAAPPACPEQAA
jgi:hypothetical protein